jgi:sialidase-1
MFMKNWIRIGLLIAVGHFVGVAAEFEGAVSKWKGFEKVSFEVNGQRAYVVLPETPVEGNPWVWRARFPTWHAEMDQELLKRGISIGYIDVANLFGSPVAVAHWDEFHTHMVSNGMSERVALEGVSRGGLICFNWAKKNPEKVACMYLEAPVCDIKSWPGGMGSGKGAAKEWGKTQDAYGHDEAGLLAWADNPIDNLEALALAKVPIYTAISLKDQIVPPTENILKLMERYVELGGPITIYPMTEGEQKLEGHHFPLEHPERIVDFIFTPLSEK